MEGLRMKALRMDRGYIFFPLELTMYFDHNENDDDDYDN